MKGTTYFIVGFVLLLIASSCSKDVINDGITGEYIGDYYIKTTNYKDDFYRDTIVTIVEKTYLASRIQVKKGENNGDYYRSITLNAFNGNELLYTVPNLEIKLENKIHEIDYPSQISDWRKNEFVGSIINDSLELVATYKLYGKTYKEIRIHALKVKGE